MPKLSPDISVIIPQLDDEQSRPLMAKMARIFRQIGAMGEMKRFSQNLRLPQEARRLSQRAYSLYDQYLAYVIGKLQKNGWRVYCDIGCAACCFAMPGGISNWEFLIIYDFLQQAGQLEKFFRRNLESCQVLDQVRGQPAGEFKGEQFSGKSEYDKLLIRYSQLRHPCAFLDDSQECLIYPVRPLACRMHFACTPPELCDPTHPRFSQAVRLNLNPHTPVEEVLQRLDGHLNLNFSDLLAPGLVTLSANIMRFSPISWI
ncbi:MAG: YkgJ family cysteine cluster protein [Deltaproteobacteria bacterium]|nr:MAG: YkgJ family cysteine cluster protein [Deltaproteobacteria bacterium]